MSKPNEEVLGTAYTFLKNRSYASAELQRKLLSKGYAESDVEEVVSYLTERKFLDDKHTTQSLIERKSGKRAVGRERLSAELVKRGIPEEIVSEQVANLHEGDRALDALIGKFSRDESRERASRFLWQRGFDEEAIEFALARFFQE